VTAGSDLAVMIERENVGRIYGGNSPWELAATAQLLVDDPAERRQMALRAREVAVRQFSPARAVAQITAALRGSQLASH
jgi:glycosyltransferase involved in cell wall biosynthesis